jgi:rubrerythrin
MSTDKTPQVSESLQNKVAQAASLLTVVPEVKEAHEAVKTAALQEGANALDIAQYCQEIIWTRLAQMGVYKDDTSHDILMAATTKEGTARRHFCENGEPQIPEVRFAAIWAILKSGNEEEKSDDLIDYAALQKGMNDMGTAVAEHLKANRPIGQWSDEELLRQYDPNCQPAIVDELRKRSKDRPFVIFSNEQEGIVDVAASSRMLKEARKRQTPTIYKMADALKTLYKAGEFPSIVYYECPLHPDVLLLEGFCDQCGHTWEAVPDEARQFARLVMEDGDAPSRGPSLRQFINDARQGVDTVAQDYPQTKVRFDNLKAEDKLPSLKRRTATAESTVADPFHAHKRF